MKQQNLFHATMHENTSCENMPTSQVFETLRHTFYTDNILINPIVTNCYNIMLYVLKQIATSIYSLKFTKQIKHFFKWNFIGLPHETILAK